MYEAIVISMEMPKKFKDGIQGQYTTLVEVFKITTGICVELLEANP